VRRIEILKIWQMASGVQCVIRNPPSLVSRRPYPSFLGYRLAHAFLGLLENEKSKMVEKMEMNAYNGTHAYFLIIFYLKKISLQQ
jgi:hypothetical protein